MLKSGIAVQAMRPGPKGGPAQYIPCDITDLSDDEFLKWWVTIQTDQDKFYVANTLRRLTHNLSDYGDEQAP
jgi:hypothetical protein